MSSVELALVLILGISEHTEIVLNWFLILSCCFNLVFSVRAFLGYDGCEVECQEVYIQLATAILFVISAAS
jgi:hypothetical protein